jgi:type I restriction enzyme S subunit
MGSELSPAALRALDEIPADWTKATLQTIAEIFDCPHSTPLLTDSGAYLVRTQDVRSGTLDLNTLAHVSEETYLARVKRATPMFGDLLYSREGTYFGSAALVPSDAKVCLGQRMVHIRPDQSNVDHVFLKYWLNSPVMARHISGLRDGTVAERLNVSTIRRLPVAFPDLRSQIEISSTLQALDDRINLLHQTNTTLEGIARALFKSWFVDFDPVHAKAEGREPEAMDATTTTLFPSEFEESELGLIPKGWRVMPLLDACDLQGGGQPPASTFVDEPKAGYVRLLQIRDFSTNAHPTYIPESKKLKTVQTDDILIGRYGSASGDKQKDSLGRICRGLEGAYNVALMKLVPVAVGREFALQVFNDQNFYNYLQGVSAKAVQSGFSKKELALYKVVVPSDELLTNYESWGAAIWQRVKSGRQRIATLTALRDALLPRLVSGKLRLPEATEAVGAALA